MEFVYCGYSWAHVRCSPSNVVTYVTLSTLEPVQGGDLQDHTSLPILDS